MQRLDVSATERTICRACCCTGHFPACLRAFTTRVGTFLTVIHFVLCAFFAAGIANLGAELTNSFSELRAARHFSHRERADVGAATVEFDAARHHLYVFFVQAGGCAVFTGLHALVAGLDTVFVFFVGHDGMAVLCFGLAVELTPENLRRGQRANVDHAATRRVWFLTVLSG
jgi:hypothetical protein